MVACIGQTVKLRRLKGMGQANPPAALRLEDRAVSFSGIHAGASEGVLYGSGLPLVTAARDRLGSGMQFGSRRQFDPIVASGSSPSRTPSDFPIGARNAPALSSRLVRLSLRRVIPGASYPHRRFSCPTGQPGIESRSEPSEARRPRATWGKHCPAERVFFRRTVRRCAPLRMRVLFRHSTARRGVSSQATTQKRQSDPANCLDPEFNAGPKWSQAAATSGSPEPERTPHADSNRDLSEARPRSSARRPGHRTTTE